MRKFTWLIAAGLAASTTGCVETMDTSYSPGYDSYNNGGYNTGYYSQPTYYRPAPVNNYYYTPAPVVVHDTRYVPVPVPAARPSEHRDANVQHHSDPTTPAATHPTTTTPPANNQQTNRRRPNTQDREDGKTDTPRTDRRG